MTIFSTRPSRLLTFQIRPAETEDDFQAVYALRSQVFREEQRLADLPMTDPDERRSLTLMAEQDGYLIGTGRLSPPAPQRLAYLSWIATAQEYRKNGVGSAIVTELVDCRRQGRLPHDPPQRPNPRHPLLPPVRLQTLRHRLHRPRHPAPIHVPHPTRWM